MSPASALSGSRRNIRRPAISESVTTTATVGGFVDATLQDGATVGGTGGVGSLTVAATADSRATAFTRGGAGAVAGSGNQRWTCGSYAMDALDPSGAGDAFASGILTGIAHGWAMPAMLEFASALGASATRAIGTTDGVFTFDEARQFVKSNPLPIQTTTLRT